MTNADLKEYIDGKFEVQESLISGYIRDAVTTELKPVLKDHNRLKGAVGVLKWAVSIVIAGVTAMGGFLYKN